MGLFDERVFFGEKKPLLWKKYFIMKNFIRKKELWKNSFIRKPNSILQRGLFDERMVLLGKERSTIILGADATGRLHRLGSNLGARGPHCICQQLSWLHVGAVLTLELCWVHVGATWSSVGTTSAHVRSKLGLFWRYVGAERVYVGPFWSFVGALLAHVGSMLGPSSPI